MYVCMYVNLWMLKSHTRQIKQLTVNNLCTGTDVNECSVKGFCGAGATSCSNSAGSFTCKCDKGYKIDNGSKKCVIEGTNHNCVNEFRITIIEHDDVNRPIIVYNLCLQKEAVKPL